MKDNRIFEERRLTEIKVSNIHSSKKSSAAIIATSS